MNSDILNCLLYFNKYNIIDEVLFTVGILIYDTTMYDNSNDILFLISDKKNYMLNFIGMNYSRMENYTKSIEYYLKSIELGYYISLSNIAFIYYRLEDYSTMFKYAQLAILNNNCLGYLVLARYYEKFEYYNLAIENAIKVFDSGNINHSLHQLLNLFYKVNDVDMHVKLLFFGFDYKDEECLWELLKYFITLKNSSRIIELCHYAVYECKYIEFINVLGLYYCKLGKIFEMKNTFLLGISMYDSESMLSFGKYYACISDYSSMLKYYTLSIENCNVNAMIDLGKYYLYTNDGKNAVRYLKLASKYSNVESIILLLEISQFENNNEDFITLILKLFEIKYDYGKYSILYNIYNKLKKINTVFECPITLETVSSGFKTKCGHLFSNALLLINDSKCPCCRAELC